MPAGVGIPPGPAQYSEAPGYPRLMADSLDSALHAAAERFTAANPLSKQRWDAARQSLPGGNTRTVLFHDPFPLAFAGGRDATLTTLDGATLTDFLGEFTAGLFGHSEARILRAVHEALDSGISLGGHNDREQHLARLLCERFDLGLVRFTNSGTEANLMALALAVEYTRRPKVLVFRGGYHGGVLSFSDKPSPVTVPHQWIVADYNDVSGTRALIREHAGDLAAVLVEPMLGSGGAIPGDPGFLQMLRDEASAAKALLIFDEVMSSRLGPGGLQRELGIQPDLTTLGKYLGGGMSFGAFGGRADVMACFDPTRNGHLAHAGTFNNNVLTMAAGVAGLTEVLTDAALADLNARGDRLRDGLAALFDERGVTMHASGIGSILTLHFVPGPIHRLEDAAAADPRLRQLLFLWLADHGFWIAQRGFIALSLPVTDADCDRFVECVGSFIDEYRDLLPAPGLRVRVIRGDITEQRVDAIVNAASPAMRGGGGVDGAIHRAAGPGLLAECVERFPSGLPVGGAGWTDAHDLPASRVIHAVGPVHGSGSRDELVSAYVSALRVADELGARTIAFPLISAGVYGWPRADAIQAGFDGIAASGTSVREVRFVTPHDDIARDIEAALWRVTPLRILQSVRSLHERGFESVRARPGMSPSGMYWRVSVMAGARDILGYTTGNGSDVVGMDVTAATPAEAVADHLLSLSPGLEPAADAAYAEWYRDLLRLVEENAALPIAFADYFDDADGWEIGWGSGIRVPHPPEAS